MDGTNLVTFYMFNFKCNIIFHQKYSLVLRMSGVTTIIDKTLKT
jgi:hypothetical protein